ALHNFDKGEWNLPALGIWATYPFEAVSNANSFFDQVVGTWILLLSICAITDERNMSVHKMLIPIYVGFTVMAIGMALAFNCGYAINPARDLGPRLFTLFASLGTANKGLPFTANNYFFWIPIVAPIVGGILGAWSYQLMVGFHVAPAPGAPVMEMAEKGQFLPKDTLDAETDRSVKTDSPVKLQVNGNVTKLELEDSTSKLSKYAMEELEEELETLPETSDRLLTLSAGNQRSVSVDLASLYDLPLPDGSTERNAGSAKLFGSWRGSANRVHAQADPKKRKRGDVESTNRQRCEVESALMHHRCTIDAP
ncbi:unnamed protein product, partial [Darwinula stevensoni]